MVLLLTITINTLFYCTEKTPSLTLSTVSTNSSVGSKDSVHGKIVNEWMDRWIEWTDEWREWTNGWIGWTNGQIKWTDGWIH